MKKNILFFAACILFFLTSCESNLYLKWTKGRYISHFEHFIDSVEEDYTDFKKEEDWSKSDEAFASFNEEQYELYRHVLNDYEKDKVNQLSGKYKAMKFKFYGERTMDGIKSFGSELKGFLEEITE